MPTEVGENENGGVGSPESLPIHLIRRQCPLCSMLPEREIWVTSSPLIGKGNPFPEKQKLLSKLSLFLARLNKSSGRAVIVTLALASASSLQCPRWHKPLDSSLISWLKIFLSDGQSAVSRAILAVRRQALFKMMVKP